MSQARAWCWTLNNWTAAEKDDLEQVIEERGVRYIVFGEETGEQGTPHLQGFIYFENQRMMRGIKRLIGERAHLEPCFGSSEDAINYCKKGEQPHAEWQQQKHLGPNWGLNARVTELGEIPTFSARARGAQGAERYNEAIALAKEGKFDDIIDSYPDLWLRFDSKFKAFYKPSTTIREGELTNFWIHGEPGTGKSRFVRERWPDVYDKPLNKWWDGYAGEPVAHLEEVEPSHASWLGAFLKRWADRYEVRVEQKGGSILINPETIVVTSNYSIEEVFGADPKMMAAINRRFVEVLAEHNKPIVL